MQKAKNFSDVYRFRKYLGREYTASKLPIITIYILGFNLSVDSPAFGNVPVFRDLRTNEELHFRDMFVEQLTHSAYFVQTLRIKPSLNTRLDKLLSIFEQNNFAYGDQTTKDYTLEIDDPDVKTVVDILHYVAANPEARKELDRERYYMEAMDDIFGEQSREFLEKMEKNEKKLEEAEKKIEEKGKQLEETGKQLEKTGKQLEEKGKQL